MTYAEDQDAPNDGRVLGRSDLLVGVTEEALVGLLGSHFDVVDKATEVLVWMDELVVSDDDELREICRRCLAPSCVSSSPRQP